MKYKDQTGAVNGFYTGTKNGTPLGDALAPDDDGYSHIRNADHFGTIAQDSGDDNFPTPLLLSVVITTAPTKLEYTVGDELDLTGIVVTGSYSGGGTGVVEVTVDNISGFDSSEVAESQTLTVTVDDCTATFDISVVAAE